MDILNSNVLVLNKGYMPVNIINVKRAFSMLFQNVARVVSVENNSYINYDFNSWAELSKLKIELEDTTGLEDWVETPNLIIETPRIIIVNDYNKIPIRKVRFNRRNILIRDGNTCFIPGTKILMFNGDIKNIEEIKISDEILDANGDIVKVEYVNKKYINEEIVGVRARGNGDYLSATKEHKFLLCDYNTGKYYSEGIKIEFANLKDNVFLPLIKLSRKHTKIDLFDYCDNLKYVKKIDNNYLKHYSGNKIKRYLDLDYKMGIIIGFYLTEGCEVNGHITFSFHIKEKKYTDLIKKIVKEKIDYDCKIREIPDRNTRIVELNSTIFASFIRKFCYLKNEKRFCDKRYNINFLKGLLYGVILGDGNINEDLKRIVVMMKTENLIRDLFVISILCGIYPTLSKTGIREDGRIYKSIVFNAYEYNKIINLIGFGKKYNKINKVDRNFIDSKIISKITNLKLINYEGFVYDLQVSGSKTYIANFIAVHNCQYCDNKFDSKDLNIDHIIPKSKGGGTTWKNVVCSCFICNSKKRDRTPNQAGMKLKRKPTRPHLSPTMRSKIENVKYSSWKNFISEAYWNVELVQ